MLEYKTSFSAIYHALTNHQPAKPVKLVKTVASQKHPVPLLLNENEIQIKYSERLGKGSYGHVYGGTYSQQAIAIKILDYDANNIIEEDLTDYMNEISILLQASQTEHCIKLIGYFVSLKGFCIVTEFASQGNLGSLLKTDLLLNDRWAIRTELAINLFAGLSEIHQLGILHRDIKSPNILVFPNYQIKFCDFGCAINLYGKTKIIETKPIGSLPWSAPESLENGEFTKATDTYSTGVVLWEIASGNLPLATCKSMTEFISKIMESKRDPIPCDTPPIIKNLITHCLSFFARERPTALEASNVLKNLRKPI